MSRKWKPFQDVFRNELKVGDFVVVLEQNSRPRPGLVRSVGHRSSDQDYSEGYPEAKILLARRVSDWDMTLAQHGEWSTLDESWRGHPESGHRHRVTYPLFIKTGAEHNVIRVTRDSLPPDAVRCLEENAEVPLRRPR